MRGVIALAALAGTLALTTSAAATPLMPHSAGWEYTFTDPTGDLTWNTTTGTGGTWLSGTAPFGNNTGGYGSDPLGLFDYNTWWPADGADGYDLWVRRPLDLTGYDLGSVTWSLGVDNGFALYLNGVPITAQNAEGYTYRWEYSGTFGAALQPGLNVLAVALEDHGGLTAFDMQVDARAVPEPGLLLLMAAGGAVLCRRRLIA